MMPDTCSRSVAPTMRRHEKPTDGALVYSLTPGSVRAVAGDPGVFGRNYPVVEATKRLAQRPAIYYGNVAQSAGQPGQRVAAGQTKSR